MYEVLEWLQLLSESVSAEQSANDYLLVAYIVLSIYLRKWQFFAAFFISAMLFDLRLFDTLKEHHLYLLTIILYSYIYSSCNTIKNKLACVIILLITIAFALDAVFYGENGVYGESETILYKNIGSVALCAHIFFIYSFIDLSKTRNYLRSFVNIIGCNSYSSDYILRFWYNEQKNNRSIK